MTDSAEQALIERFTQAGQGQVFAFWDKLKSTERRSMLEQARGIDLDEVTRLARSALNKNAAGPVSLEGLLPAPYECLPENGGDATAWARAKALGDAALRAGRVAAFTVAGGQGTRLSYDGPKGAFLVTPVERKPLFQVFAEKIAAASRRYGRPLHWFIMTSPANHAQTRAFFTQHRFFGLNHARVHFFQQGQMPAVDFSGRIILESRCSIALSPDGHGGSLRALHRSGALDLMQAEGIDLLSYFQVDNPLVRCIDPAFIGWHILRGSEMTSKMVPKAYPEERVGHFCLRDGKLVVIEYSDMPPALQREVDPRNGQLRYPAGNIAIHLIDREFVRRMALAPAGQTLPFHRAEKKIPTIDADGQAVKPAKANGVKFEMFVFDALPFASNPTVIETRRTDDFSPVKNADGHDSPQTCRDDQLRQFARWLMANGTQVETDATGLPTVTLEVSPLFGYDEDSFADSWQKLSPKPAIVEGLYLE